MKFNGNFMKRFLLFYTKYHWYIWKYLKKYLDMVLWYISNVHSHKNIKVLCENLNVKIYVLFLNMKLVYKRLGLTWLHTDETLQATTTFNIDKKDNRLQIILCKQEILWFPFVKKCLIKLRTFIIISIPCLSVCFVWWMKLGEKSIV